MSSLSICAILFDFSTYVVNKHLIIVDTCPLTKYEGWQYLLHEANDDAIIYGWNLQRLQHSRNNSAATLNAAYYELDPWVEKWDVSHISRVTFRPIIARSSSTVARPSDHSSWQHAEQETVWLKPRSSQYTLAQKELNKMAVQCETKKCQTFFAVTLKIHYFALSWFRKPTACCTVSFTTIVQQSATNRSNGVSI